MNTVAVAQPTPPQAIRAAWIRYLVVSAGLAFLVVTILVIIWPWPYELVVQRVLLPAQEEAFGFHGGMIRPPDSEYSVYGITSVVPGGRLDRAGVKAGDLVVYGPMALHEALQDATKGEHGEFSVVSDPRDWFRNRELAREITVDPK